MNLVVNLPPVGSSLEKSYYLNHNWNSDSSFYLGFSVSLLNVFDPIQSIAFIREGIADLFTIIATY